MRNRDLPVAIILAGGLAAVTGCAPGHVSVSTRGAEVHLRRGWSGTTIVGRGDGDTALNPGIYKTRFVRLSKREANEGGRSSTQGARWILDSHGPFGELRSVVVREGETTVLKPGPPLALEVTAHQRGPEVRIGFQVKGNAGEVYRPVASRSGKRQPRASVRILDASGKVLASGHFEYG